MMASERIPAHVFPAGSFVADELWSRGWTTADLAARTGWPIETVRALVCCEVGVTDAMADDLARAFGTSAALWRNLQATYDRASG